MCREGKDENPWQHHRLLRPSYLFLPITLMPPRPALFLLSQPGNYLSSGGGQICWLRVNAEGGEGEGRSFPRLLPRKSCSSLQPEYSWAAEAATVFSVLIPPPVSPHRTTQGTRPEVQSVYVCPSVTRIISAWLDLSTCSCQCPTRGIIQMVKHRCHAACAGVIADPRQASLNHADIPGGGPNGDGRTVIVSLLAHCEFIASIPWLTFKFCVHEQNATNSTATCTDSGWREGNHTQLRVIMRKGGY